MYLSASQSIIVTPELTASEVGSGLLPVYATPAVAALMESTACKCLELTDIPAEDTTVGSRIDIQHIKPSAIGERIICKAMLVEQDNRKYHFSIEVTDSRNIVVAKAEHERVRVNKQSFMDKLKNNI